MPGLAENCGPVCDFTAADFSALDGRNENNSM
jgi:hypothetical protein